MRWWKLWTRLVERIFLKAKREKQTGDLRRLRTEQSHPDADDLDRKSSLEIASLINAEDAVVALAVRQALPQIARAIDLVAAGLRRGGRLIYVGAGTSGRIGALDASECPPTFNVDPRTVQYIIAGGPKALASATEASEDDEDLGRAEMRKRKPGQRDVVIGIASSGRTPFTVAAVAEARRRGAKTVALTCNRSSPLERAAQLRPADPGIWTLLASLHHGRLDLPAAIACIGNKAGSYLNIGGRLPMPARFTPNGIRNTDLRSLGPDGYDLYNAETHYRNTDFSSGFFR